MRLTLLERHRSGTRFADAHAFWINQRSRVARAVVNGPPERAELAWVFTQDPVDDEARAAIAADLARLRPGVPVLNPLVSYDAYHRDDAFPRLAAAGVRVPRLDLRPGDDTVYKAQGEQAARKVRAPYDGPRPGYRAFGWADGRGPDGAWRRYRAFHLAGLVWPADVIISGEWNVGLATLDRVEHTFALTPEEAESVRLLARTLELDFFAVDYLRRRGDGAAVFLDVNVYPTIVVSETVTDPLGLRGQWHFWELPARVGVAPPVWDAVDRTLLGLTTPRPG